jgi:hypothetical protein
MEPHHTRKRKNAPVLVSPASNGSAANSCVSDVRSMSARMCAASRQLVTRAQLKISRDWIAIAAGVACVCITVGDIRL